MPAEIFTAFLITSLAGSCLAAVIALLKLVTKKIFSASWRYYIWLAVLLVMMLPVRFAAPRKAATAPINTEYTATVEQTAETNVSQPIVPAAAVKEKPNLIKSEVTRVKGIIDSKLDMFALLWVIGAVMFFVFNIIGYIRLLIKLHRGSVVVPCPELKNFTNKRVTVRVWDITTSPFTVGVFKPTLVLPKAELTTEQLRNILRHETTHIKRKDILYKWFVVLVKCVHWFNPVIYYVTRQINTECEISCDLSVIREMSAEEEQSYVNTILSLLPDGRSAANLTTGMTGSKKVLKRRFEMIKNKRRTSKAAAVVSALLAAALLTTTVFASGVISDLTADEYTIEITNNGKKIELVNKPFIENNTVYLPLREMLNLEGITDITYKNNGYAEFSIDAVPPVEYRGLEYNFWINRIQIGNPYAYIAGHSGGTTENAELLCAPILKEDTIYVPFDLFDKLKTSGQGVFENVTVTAKNSNSTLAGILYRNEDLNFKVELPLGWEGKYGILEEGTSIRFLQTATWDKYGTGTLCRVERVSPETADELLNMLGGSELLYSDENYAYIYEIPTDVQYPVWVDRDEEDVAIAAEYQEMFKQVGFIKNSFEIIAHTGTTPPFTAAEVAAARTVVETYWRAETAHDRETILKTVTEPNRADNVIYFDEGDKITLDDIRYAPSDSTRANYITYGGGNVKGTKYEDVIVFRVDYTVDKGYSAYNERQYTDWSMILIRDGKGGEWLIDDQGY